MRKYLTEKSIRYIIAQCKQGRRTATIAYETNVTQRHIQRIWAEFRKTGGTTCTKNSWKTFISTIRDPNQSSRS